MTRTKKFDDILGDVFNIRDVIARYEELESERDAYSMAGDDDDDEDGPTAIAEASRFTAWATDNSDDANEFCRIKDFLDEVEGYGGGEQWRSSWYPVTFIADSYFPDYAEELVKDIGDIPRDIPSYIVIDWEATADNLKTDYLSVDIDGQTYWYRN